MSDLNDIKQQFVAARKRLAKHYYSELIEAEGAYSAGQSEKLLDFGSLGTGNWSQVQAVYLWITQNCDPDGDLIELCNLYPATAPNLLNALQAPDDRLKWLEISSEKARQLHDIEAEKVHLGNMALTCRTAGRLEKQLQYIEQLKSLYLSEETSDASAILCMLGEVYRLSGRYQEAIQNLEQAYPILESHGHPLTSYACHNLGITYRNLGDTEQGKYFHELEKKTSENEQDWMSLSRANVSLGILYQEELEIEKAITYYSAAQIAIEKAEENPSPRNSYIFCLEEKSRRAKLAYGYSNENWQKFNKIPILGNMGALESQTGNYAIALRLLEDTIQLCKDLVQKRYESIWLHKIGVIHACLGQLEDSQVSQKQSLAIANDIKAVRAIGFAYFGLGKAEIIKICLQKNILRTHIDTDNLVKAFEIAQKTKNLRDLQEWGAELTEAYLLSKNFREAEAILETIKSLDVRENHYRVVALQGILLLYSGELEKCRTTLNSALDEIEKIVNTQQRLLSAIYIQGRVMCHIALTETEDQGMITLKTAETVYRRAVALSPLAKGQMATEYRYLRNLQVGYPQHSHLYSDLLGFLEGKAALE